MTKEFSSGLSRKHWFHFGPLRRAAWEKHCSRDLFSNIDDEIAEDKWYREQLMAALGIYSTKQAAASKYFAKLCAHFEQIAGHSCYWTVRAELGEDRRRLLWWIDQALKHEGRDESYAQGIADQMNRGELERMGLPDLFKVFVALDEHIRRTAPDWRKKPKQTHHRRAA